MRQTGTASFSGSTGLISARKWGHENETIFLPKDVLARNQQTILLIL
jgi:hypothetical protein